jgi:hypothetical protein
VEGALVERDGPRRVLGDRGEVREGLRPEERLDRRPGTQLVRGPDALVEAFLGLDDGGVGGLGSASRLDVRDRGPADPALQAVEPGE